MLANILVKPGKIEIRKIDTPNPSRGELLIKVKSALTCGTDLKAFKRGHPLIPMPGVFGHEFSGIVSAVGKGNKKFKVGDEIIAVHSAPCLKCRYCKKRLYNLCEKIMDRKVLGAFAEYILLPSHIVRQNVFHKPKNLSFEEAAFLEPLSCVVHSIEPLNIKNGERVLIIGAGPIGLLHILLLKNKGAIVAIMDKHDSKLAIANKLGANVVIKSSSLLPVSPLPRLEWGGIGFDYLFECTGQPNVWESSVYYVRRGGTVILFGGCREGAKVTYDAGRLHYDEITLKGDFHYTPSDVKKAYKILCKRKIDVSKLISGRYKLKHTQKAFDKLSKGTGIKYAIVP